MTKQFTVAGIDFKVHDNGQWVEVASFTPKKGLTRTFFHGDHADLDAQAHVTKMIRGIRGYQGVVTARVIEEIFPIDAIDDAVLPEAI